MARTKLERAAEAAARGARLRLAEDVERLCADAGISHAALAHAAGISPPFLARILAGTTRPSIETYARLSTALGADLGTRFYPNTGPAIHDRLSVPVLEGLLDLLHPRWRAHTEVRVRRPGRGWIDVVLEERREGLFVAGEIQSTLNRVEQLIRWSGEKAESLPSWEAWPVEGTALAASRLLIVRWTRATRDAARAAERQLRVAYPAHPEDALGSLTGTLPWPGPALLWARVDAGSVRLVASR
ncbi:MAG TPA: helix-turn-helix transcriptional regulator [Candidatus Limnocylindrales bacterium]|nr:helix-turn-helix transcriptional regulator [Candidatus Limnocylindrales bacterium]